MRRLILSGSTALALLFATVSCSNDDDKEIIINATDLPVAAQDFVGTTFPNATYSYIKKEKKPESDGSLYDVYLSNNFEIEFDINGNWIDIDGNNQSIPVHLIPEKIQTYVTTNYPNQFVTSIDNEKTHTEIELSNTIELIFDLQGNFVRIDK